MWYTVWDPGIEKKKIRKSYGNLKYVIQLIIMYNIGSLSVKIVPY